MCDLLLEFWEAVIEFSYWWRYNSFQLGYIQIDSLKLSRLLKSESVLRNSQINFLGARLVLFSTSLSFFLSFLILVVNMQFMYYCICSTEPHLGSLVYYKVIFVSCLPPTEKYFKLDQRAWVSWYGSWRHCVFLDSHRLNLNVVEGNLSLMGHFFFLTNNGTHFVNGESIMYPLSMPLLKTVKWFSVQYDT